MAKKRNLSYGYVHDVLHHDYGYTTDEIDEIVENKPNIFTNSTNKEIVLLAIDVITKKKKEMYLLR